MFRVISIGDSQVWDSIVKGFKNYDVFYLNLYAKAFQNHGDGEPRLFYYDDGDTRAINVLMVRDIAEISAFNGTITPGTCFDISSPYGYGGFLVEGSNYQGINAAYNSYIQEQQFVSEFVRFHLFSQHRPYYSGSTESSAHNIVCDLSKDMGDIVNEFEYKVRKNLKKADRAGLEIQVDTIGTRVEDFMSIYNETMLRNNAEDTYFFSLDFFKTLNMLKGNYTYFYVINDHEIISTELVLYGSENCYSFLGGTRSDYFQLRPNDFLKYQIIKWAKEKGLKRYILGGGYGGDESGIYRYKKSFAPNGVYDFYIGKYVINSGKYEDLVDLRFRDDRLDQGVKFFPAYRM